MPTSTDFLLAVRNLLRNWRRSVSTLVALALGLTAILLFNGFEANLKATMHTAVLRVGGHLQVQHKDYFLFGGGNPAAYGIAGYAPLLQRLRQDPALAPMLAVATPMLRFGGLAGNFDAGITRTVIGSAYEAADISRMRQWNEFKVPGTRRQFPLEGTQPDAAIVGIGVARVLQLCGPLNIPQCPQPSTSESTRARSGKSLPDDIAALAQAENATAQTHAGGARIELLTSSARGAPNVTTLNIVAAEDQMFKELDEVSVLVHLEQAQRLVFGRKPPQVTALMIQLKRTADVQRAHAHVQRILREAGVDDTLVVRDFLELNPFHRQSEQLFDFIFAFIFVLIGGIVLFTVGNTMNTAVVERTVEIGTLRAIGLRQQGVRRLFMVEGLMLGLAGAVLGLLMSMVLGALVNRSGLTWLPPGSSEHLPLQLRVLGNLGIVAGTATILVLIATVSAWWPAWRAAHLKIVEALRHA